MPESRLKTYSQLPILPIAPAMDATAHPIAYSYDENSASESDTPLRPGESRGPPTPLTEEEKAALAEVERMNKERAGKEREDKAKFDAETDELLALLNM
jgi:hypothetical protein